VEEEEEEEEKKEEEKMDGTRRGKIEQRRRLLADVLNRSGFFPKRRKCRETQERPEERKVRDVAVVLHRQGDVASDERSAPRGTRVDGVS